MNDTTDITIVLDRSGSMQAIRSDTIGGFNSFLADQRKIPGKARLTVVQFDHEFETVFQGRDIHEPFLLTEETFVPRGNTALYDAMGRAIADAGSRFARLSESLRPKRVIFVVITDGAENASTEYSRARVAAMVKDQRETYNWEFVFIGANQDAVTKGAEIGIAIAANFVADASGTSTAFANVSRGIANYRSGGGYTP
jgi:Mg-chelatase subunit ChlD